MCSDLSDSISILTACDEICSNPENVSSRLIDYLAWSNNPGFLWETCLEEMTGRTPPDKMSTLNYKSYESHVFEKRYKLLSSNNIAFDLATKVCPTVADLETFSQLEPSWSTLFPVKQFIVDHPDMAKSYRGMLPFGKEVILSFNTMIPPQHQIKKSPTFADHLRLRDLTNRKSDLTGIPTVTLNTMMYKHGRTL